MSQTHGEPSNNVESFVMKRRKIYGNADKDIPVWILVVVFINVIFYNMTSSVVFSFLPRMVKNFGATELNTGCYAGIVASSVYVGRLFFSMAWGYLTDTVGKKRSCILTGAILLVYTLAFGFTRNIYWATVTRFLQGCAMGQVIVSKAILADVCDDTTISLGMSIVMTALVTGQAIGPSIGGFLAFPGNQYPRIFSPRNVFSKYSILLPNIVISVGLSVGVILTTLFIPNDKMRRKKDEHPVTSYGSMDEHMELGKRNEEDLLLEPGNHAKHDETRSPTSPCKDSIPKRQAIGALAKFRQSRLVLVLKEKDCLFSSLLYGMFSLTDVGFIEMFPVLAATDPAYKGFGFDTRQIGIVLMVVSLLLVALQLTLLPKLNKKFGSKRLLMISNIALAFLCPLLPSIVAIRARTWMWISLLLLIFCIRACVFTSYLSLNILVNNSVGPSLFGSANGVSMTFASVGRLTGPLLFGSLFSWSLTNIKGVQGNENALGFPFDQYLIFILLSGWSVLIAVLTSRLPDSLDLKKVMVQVQETVLSNE